MKILSGKYKGKTLKTFSNPKVRPTCGVVKEAVFNICSSSVEGARFLDLFAGVGSVGFEALSRGADSVTFVDLAPESVRLIWANSRLLGEHLPIHVLRQDVRSALQRLKKKAEQFDLIYLDPPYNLENEFLATVLQDIVAGQLLAENGLIFLENASPDSIVVAGLEERKRRKIGGTFLTEYVCSKEDIEAS